MKGGQTGEKYGDMFNDNVVDWVAERFGIRLLYEWSGGVVQDN